jgi:hypothetical protein
MPKAWSEELRKEIAAISRAKLLSQSFRGLAAGALLMAVVLSIFQRPAVSDHLLLCSIAFGILSIAWRDH